MIPGAVRSKAVVKSLLVQRGFPSMEQFGHMGVVSPAWSLEMNWTWLQVLGLSVALLLLGSGVWANIGGGSLSQNKGAWVSHAYL
jgi:hypothetical protein